VLFHKVDTYADKNLTMRALQNVFRHEARVALKMRSLKKQKIRHVSYPTDYANLIKNQLGAIKTKKNEVMMIA